MWSINRWASHAELLKISTMNFLYSSIKRNNKTYLNGKKDWFEPFFQPHGFWRSAIPSRQLCLLSGPHRSGCFTPKQELLPQPPPPPLRCRQREAGAGGLLCRLTVFPGMCTVVEMGRDFQTHGLKWHDETLTGGGWGGRDVPKPSEQKFHKWISFSLNLLFIFLSMMWIRGQGALSITRFKKSGELMKFIVLQPFKYF